MLGILILSIFILLKLKLRKHYLLIIMYVCISSLNIKISSSKLQMLKCAAAIRCELQLKFKTFVPFLVSRYFQF